jgi:hypothetical protein
VHSQGKVAEVKDEMLAPRKDLGHSLTPKARDANAAIAANAFQPPADEWPELFGREMDRRTFHGCW